MIFRLKYLAILVLLSSSYLFSQEDTVYLNLEKTLQLALESSTAYKSNLVENQIAEQQILFAKSLLYPQVSAGVDVRYNIARPVSLLPGETVGKPGEVVIAKLGSKFGGVPAIDVNQVIYDAELFAEMKLLKENRAAGNLEAAVIKGKIKLHVSKSYFNVLINQAQLQQLRQTEKRLRHTLEEIQTKVDAGIVPNIELERAMLLIEATKSEINKTKQSLDLNKSLLKYSLGLTESQKVILEKPQKQFNPEKDYQELLSETLDITQLPEIQAQKHRIQLSKLKIEQQQKHRLPTVSFYSRIGFVSLGKKFEEIDGEDLSIYLNSYAGLKLKWRLNNFLDNKYILPQLQLQVQQSELQLKEQERLKKIEVAQALNKLSNALETYRLFQQKEAFAQKELNYLSIHFQNDLASSKALIEAEETLLIIQQSLQVAYYEYLTARLQIMASRGNYELIKVK